jgi:hypothetical protein
MKKISPIGMVKQFTQSPRPKDRGRRGALLLLVLSMLTLFLMMGTLMMVLATRARSTARAFADTVAGPGNRAAAARGLLDEALMRLLRGAPPADHGEAPAPDYESLLADRYGGQTLEGQLTAPPMAAGPVLTANVEGINPANPLELAGRILTIKPQVADSAPVSSFRVLSVSGLTFRLANLRTVAVRPLPIAFPCDVFVNGREFGHDPDQDNNAADHHHESWDAFDNENQFLTQASGNGTTVLVTRPAYGAASQELVVDNDGDGVADGIWLEDFLPAQADGSTARVSFLVLDLCGRLNVNAHGTLADNPGSGPAAVDGATVFADSAIWNRLLEGGASPTAPQAPTEGNRRAAPALGSDLQGRFGDGPTETYSLRLDFDGPRLASRSAPAGNVFTCGELEWVLRPYDADTTTLPPRLAALLGVSAEAERMLVTTDSWDTCGMVGPIFAEVVKAAEFDSLPEDVKEGLRFDLDHPKRSLGDLASKQQLFTGLVATLRAAGVDDPSTAQWVANVIDFADDDTISDKFDDDQGGEIYGVEPSSIEKNGVQVFTGWDRGRIESVGELMGVPRGTKQQLEDALRDEPPPNPEIKALLRSLAVENSDILDVVTVGSPFRSTVYLNVAERWLCRWREPGRVNVNTCEDRIWDAVTGKDIANPFKGATPARSLADLFEKMPNLFSQADKHAYSLDRELASRLGNIATTRSDVFAVWITLEVKQAANDPTPAYHRLFAIIDRSIPVGHAAGQNLNARDTIRVLRYLD